MDFSRGVTCPGPPMVRLGTMSDAGECFLPSWFFGRFLIWRLSCGVSILFQLSYPESFRGFQSERQVCRSPQRRYGRQGWCVCVRRATMIPEADTS